jgi:hypothetical protein
MQQVIDHLRQDVPVALYSMSTVLPVGMHELQPLVPHDGCLPPTAGLTPNRDAMESMVPRT